jgi:P27 family predicted phage terminase small subunit
MLRSSRPPLLPAPTHLGPSEKELWDNIVRSFAIDDAAAQELLLQACEARGRARQAREQLDEEGCTYRDARGDLKQHPAIAIERSSQAAFCSAMRLLRLDINGERK